MTRAGVVAAVAGATLLTGVAPARAQNPCDHALVPGVANVHADERSCRAGLAAWLDRILAEVAAGRLALVPAAIPIGFLPVDPADLALLADPAIGGGTLDAAAVQAVRAGSVPGGEEAVAAATRLRAAPGGAAPASAEIVAAADGAPAAGGRSAPYVFTSDRPIPVNFARLPGTNDWIAIAVAGAPDDAWVAWRWSDGSSTPDRPPGTPRREGRIVFDPLPPGSYEVRIYFDWPAGGYRVRGRRPLTILPAAASPVAAPPPAAPPAAPRSAAVATERSSYAQGEPITVHFRDFPGTADWITIVTAGSPDDRFGEWYWTDGSASPNRPLGTPRREGTLRFAGLPAGAYEVRAYLDWPNGGYTVRARQAVGVASAAAPPVAARPAAAGTLGSDFPASLAARFSNGWTATMTRRGSSDDYDMVYRGPSGQTVTTVERIHRDGDAYRIQRLSSSDAVLCVMEGRTTPDRSAIEGTGSCPGVNAGWGFRITAPGS